MLGVSSARCSPQIKKKVELFQQFKPDIPEADIVLRDEEGIADIDDAIMVDIGLLELLGAGSRFALQSHNLFQHVEGIDLVDLAVLVGISEEDGGDLDVVGFCADHLPSIDREPDGVVARGGVYVSGIPHR